jgi:hypothetical protein
MQHDICIAVAGQSARVLDADAAEQQRPARFQAVGIMANPDAHASDLSKIQM